MIASKWYHFPHEMGNEKIATLLRKRNYWWVSTATEQGVFASVYILQIIRWCFLPLQYSRQWPIQTRIINNWKPTKPPETERLEWYPTNRRRSNFSKLEIGISPHCAIASTGLLCNPYLFHSVSNSVVCLLVIMIDSDITTNTRVDVWMAARSIIV